MSENTKQLRIRRMPTQKASISSVRPYAEHTSMTRKGRGYRSQINLMKLLSVLRHIDAQSDLECTFAQTRARSEPVIMFPEVHPSLIQISTFLVES